MRQVGDVRATDDRHHVVLAVALQADVAQQHDLVVAVGLLEGAFEQRDRIDVVAVEELLIGPGDAGRGIDQSLARRVVAGPAQQGADGLFGLLAGRPIGRGRRCRDGRQA